MALVSRVTLSATSGRQRAGFAGCGVLAGVAAAAAAGGGACAAAGAIARDRSQERGEEK